MHKKISIGLCITIAILSIMATVLITTAVTMSVYSSLVSDLPEREAMYNTLAEVDNLIRNNYLGTTEEETVNEGIANGYLGNLTIGRNYFMSASQYSEYKAKQSGTDRNGDAITTVSSKKFSNAGYIKITDFVDTTPDEFKKAYNSIKNNSLTGLVIDVRDTDSINIDAAAKIIDMIVPLASEGTQSIATAVDKNNTNAKIFSADSNSIDIPVSVIVNESTSGAGELIACDIRDFGKGTVVGKTTAGNGTYQQVFELSDGSAVVLTVAKLLPYTSDCYEGTGVKPDYETELTEKTDDLNKDTQFLQAYASVSSLQK